MVTDDSLTHPVILFDGVCNLCNTSVQFIVKRDPNSIFKFTSLQSVKGQELLTKYSLPKEFQSIILIMEGKSYQQSSAALIISSKLNRLWPLLTIFIFVPASIRNAVYNWIARNRYRWFGKQNECMIPTVELKSRFL